MDPSLLVHGHLSLVDRDGDGEVARIRAMLSNAVVVAGRSDVEAVLGALVGHGAPAMTRTLDLIGHSTPDRSLLAIGDWVIDGTRSKVLSFFRGLADEGVFARLGIVAIRLLGCETAVMEGGRLTLIALADTTGLEVFGTNQMISAAHCDAAGFRDDYRHVLVSSRDASGASYFAAKRGGEPYRAVLDVDALPASPLGHAHSPRRICNLSSAAAVLRLVRRTDGAQMAGVAEPVCELALPSSQPDWFHRIEILLDGNFVRVYPAGEDRPGVVFPVADPDQLRRILAELPYG